MFCGILFGLFMFLLSNQIGKNTISSSSLTASSNFTQNSSTSIASQNSVNSSSTSVSSNSENSTSSVVTSSSLSSSKTTTSQGMTFLHNEGKYIRFDYPSGWQVNVRSTNGDSFTKFEDIADVEIRDNKADSIRLVFHGPGECTNLYVDLSNTNDLAMQLISPDNQYEHIKIKNFQSLKLNNLNVSSKSLYLIGFIEPELSTTKIQYHLATFNGSRYSYADCDNTLLDKFKFTYEGVGMSSDSNSNLSIETYATILQRFLNSFQKK